MEDIQFKVMMSDIDTKTYELKFDQCVNLDNFKRMKHDENKEEYEKRINIYNVVTENGYKNDMAIVLTEMIIKKKHYNLTYPTQYEKSISQIWSKNQ